ncbi:MAG: hypothetical protein COA91_13120 [Robiginitomaculum sp.]|nr:MAG: hypothetical protein COA91_13120 [Robiginitomaculum sp.]
MLKLLSRIIGSPRAEIKDANKIYQKIMEKSRDTVFYGDDLCADTTDGRMEILCLHLATLMFVLRGHDQTGSQLSQAIYDVMIDDFDVALREEGLSDTGVARRIKPMAKMFFARSRSYADALAAEQKMDVELSKVIDKYMTKNSEKSGVFVKYIKEFHHNLSGSNLGQIAKAEFIFPKF